MVSKMMSKEIFLEKLLTCASPAGFEDEARILLNRYLSGAADRFYTDVLGNSIAVINEDAPFKVMMTGHQDEIGMQITEITEQGFLYFRCTGAPAFYRWAGCEMEIVTQDGRHVPAILLNEQTEEISAKTFQVENLFLDIGASSKKEAEKLVSLGDYVVSKPNFKYLNGNRIISKALDDKIGVYTAAQAFLKIAAKRPKNIGVYFVGAVQEELGSRGAKVAAQAIKPNVAFAIDVTNISDYPGTSVKKCAEIGLGKGVGIFRNANNTPALLERMLTVAKAKKIAFQLTPHYQAVSWTDASVLQVTEGGIATALLGIPNRYMHAQVEMADMFDVESAIELLAETVLSFKASDSFFPPL